MTFLQLKVGSTADNNEKIQGDDGLRVIDMMDKKFGRRGRTRTLDQWIMSPDV